MVRWTEQLTRIMRQSGRMMTGMSGAIATAILVFGNGLLAEPANAFSVTGEVAFTLTDLGGAEMLAVTPDGSHAVVVGGETVTLVRITADSLELVGTWELSADYYPAGSMAAELTGVAVSPDGSFALVGVKDDDDANLDTFDEVPGNVVALSIPDLSVLGMVTVGRGPDSVAIAPSGEFAAVANEDEENEEDLTNLDNRAGSISIIDLRNGTGSMTQVEVPIPPAGIPFFAHDPQPETVRISADSSFLVTTLQENNAIARIDVPASLPATLTADAFTVTIFDAGTRTGMGLVEGDPGEGNCRSSAYDPALMQEFFSAREPDGIALTPDGRYFVTADEDNLTHANSQSVDGVMLSPHGSRSISVYDAATGMFLGDSGDSIEASVISLGLPQRCDSKGPEPEVVSVGMMGDRTLAFVALERADAVSIHDITDPANIQLLDTVLLNPGIVMADGEAELEPEGIEFIPGSNQVVVSNPENGSMSLINLMVD
jgi:DNA-binding beta-propeller fold protein YncE